MISQQALRALSTGLSGQVASSVKAYSMLEEVLEADDTGDHRSDGRIETSSAFKTLMTRTRVLITGLNFLFTHPLVEKNMHSIVVCIFVRFSRFPLSLSMITVRSTLAKPPTSSSKRGAYPSRLHGGAAPSRKSS